MKDSPPEKGLAEGQKYLALGMKFGVGIVFFTLVGFWLDQRLGTTPLFILVGTLGGAGLSFFSVYRDLTGPPRDKDSTR